MKKFFRISAVCCLAVFFIAGVTSQAMAGDSEEYNPPEKLANGVVNAVFSPVEVPKAIAQTAEESGPVAGLVVGPVVGGAQMVVTAVTGVLQVATFLFPGNTDMGTPFD